MDTTIIAIISYYASVYGIDPKLALSVAIVESNLNPTIVGTHGEIGLFQIKPQVYPEIDPDLLFDIETNVKLGIKYLAWNKRYCNQQGQFEWLTCYNYGIENAKKIKRPLKFPYVRKVVYEYQRN